MASKLKWKRLPDGLYMPDDIKLPFLIERKSSGTCNLEIVTSIPLSTAKAMAECLVEHFPELFKK